MRSEQAETVSPLELLHRSADALGAAVCLTGLEGLDGRFRLMLLALVKPAPEFPRRWKTRSERLAHGTTLCSCDLRARPDLDDAAGVLLEVLAPLVAELRRRHAA